MRILLSPAKSLDFSRAAPSKTRSELLFPEEAFYLASQAARLTSAQLQDLMGISPALADLNVARFAQILQHEAPSKQAIFAFNGDVYEGLAAHDLGRKEWNYLQRHLRILSGLYGLLRPLDAIFPYRLEMGTALSNDAGKHLYAFWADKLTGHLQQELTQAGSEWVLNLASEEYAKAVKLKQLGVPVITPIFQDASKGQYKVISFFAKRARGLMLRYCAEKDIHKAKHRAVLKDFNSEGYRFDEKASDVSHWVFRRTQ